MRVLKSLTLLSILTFQVLTAWSGKCASFTDAGSSHRSDHHSSHQNHHGPGHHDAGAHCICAAALNSTAVPGTPVTAVPFASEQLDLRPITTTSTTSVARPAFFLPLTTAPPVLA